MSSNHSSVASAGCPAHAEEKELYLLFIEGFTLEELLYSKYADERNMPKVRG